MHRRRGQHEGQGKKKRDYAAKEKDCGLATSLQPIWEFLPVHCAHLGIWLPEKLETPYVNHRSIFALANVSLGVFFSIKILNKQTCFPRIFFLKKFRGGSYSWWPTQRVQKTRCFLLNRVQEGIPTHHGTGVGGGREPIVSFFSRSGDKHSFSSLCLRVQLLLAFAPVIDFPPSPRVFGSNSVMVQIWCAFIHSFDCVGSFFCMSVFLSDIFRFPPFPFKSWAENSTHISLPL